MQEEYEQNRRLASMRAGLASVAMLVAVCFALAFFLGDSNLEAKSSDKASGDDVVVAHTQP